MKISKTNSNDANSSTASGTNNENKEPPATEIGKAKKKGRHKKVKDALAPKYPLSGYIRFMNVRREELRKSHPNGTANEMTKIIGEDWNRLNDEGRKPYMEAAKIDKERYNAECVEYYAKFKKTSEQLSESVEEKPAAAATAKPTKPLKSQPQLPRRKQPQQPKISDESSSENTDNTAASVSKTNGISSASAPPSIPLLSTSQTQSQPMTIVSVDEINNSSNKPPRTGDYGIQIFTEEFLEHNKCVDSELRTLRKSNTDYEQQNSILEKHIDNMKNGIEKLVNESSELQANNEALNNYLTKLKGKLATALAGLSIPGEPNGANTDNIDKYMADLLQMASSNSHGPASLNKAKDIIRKLDLQSSK